jgi:hypothetical protein
MNRDKAIQRMFLLPVLGRPIRTKRALACAICRRRIGVLGRLLTPGFPTCDDDGCAMTRMGPLTENFRGAYGVTLRRTTLGVFARLVDLPNGRVVIQRQPILRRVEGLIDAHIDLVRWQRAFDAWERAVDPEGYEQGRVRLIPPKTIESVAAVRAHGPLAPIDPTRDLEAEVAAVLRIFRHEGAAAGVEAMGKA